MYGRAVRIFYRFQSNFVPVFSRIITPLHLFAISLKGRNKGKRSDQNQLENKIHDMAEVLVNMIIIGKEKRNLCLYYDVASGLCRYIKMDVEIPTLKTVKEGDIHRVVVSVHPEVCAVCPFWIRKSAY